MIEAKIFPIGITEHQGKVLARDLMIKVMGETFVMTIGTQEYINDLRTSSPKDTKIEPIFVTDNVESLDEITGKLLKTPIADLMPFLTKQVESKDEDNP